MGKKRCCCDRPCRQYSDSFDRADSSDLGSGWHKVSGDWEIRDNELHAITDGLVITTHPPFTPDSTPKKYAHIIRVTLAGVADGITCWKIVVWYEDQDNYRWVQFDLAAGDVAISYWERASGVNTALMAQPTDYPGCVTYSMSADAPVTICYSPLGWVTDPGEDDGVLQFCQDTPSAVPPITHGVVGFLAGWFDEWIYEEHRTSRLTCDTCGCSCLNPGNDEDYLCFPETMTMTLINVGEYPCTEWDNKEVTVNQGCMVWDQASAWDFVVSGTKTHWYSDTFLGPSGAPDPVFAWEVVCSGQGVFVALRRFFADGFSDYHWMTPTDRDAYTVWAQSTCKPLSLRLSRWDHGEIECDLPGGGSGYRSQWCESDCTDEHHVMSFEMVLTES